MKYNKLLALGFSLFVMISSIKVDAAPTTAIQHYVFFGDSLTDTGNCPEPTNITSPVLKNFNLYVPVSNPVPSDLYGKNGVPSLEFLQKSLPPHTMIDNQTKPLYSINWPLYLTYNQHQTHLTTWYQHTQHPGLSVDSINYAFASALARGSEGDNQCYHDDGTYFVGTCDAQSIIKQRQVYQQHTKNNPSFDKDSDYTYRDLQIPNLGKQVGFYLEDKGINIKDNTNFYIYIGSNDIGNYAKNNILKIILTPSRFLRRSLDQQAQLMANSVQNAAQRIKQAYTNKVITSYHIVVLTLPKLSNLHISYAYKRIPLIGSKLISTLDYFVQSYNQALTKMFKNDAHVTIAQNGAQLDRLANNVKYQYAIKNGKVCINDPSGTYIRPSSMNANCNYSDGTYFSWNNSHLVTQVNQSQAQAMSKFIIQ